MAVPARPRHFWFYDDLFLFNFRLVWPVTKASLEKYVKDEFGVDYEAENDTFGGKALEVEHNDSRTFLVGLRRWGGNADDTSCLAHECLHVAWMILDAKGVQVTQANDESLAYLTGYLMRKCLNELLPKRLRVRVDPKVKPRRRK